MDTCVKEGMKYSDSVRETRKVSKKYVNGRGGAHEFTERTEHKKYPVV